MTPIMHDIGHISRVAVLHGQFSLLAASVHSGAGLDPLLILPELKSLHDALNGQTKQHEQMLPAV